MNDNSSPRNIDELFQVPLGEFTAARNALAAKLKKNGRAAEASEVKALGKPSASAWVVNQLYWRHRNAFERLADAGERLRGAQMTGGGARALVDARREAIAELMRLATELLRDSEHTGTRDLMRRVTSTLEALSSYGSLPGAPAAGRLTGDLEAPGFEALAGLLPAGAALGDGRGRGSAAARSVSAEPAGGAQPRGEPPRSARETPAKLRAQRDEKARARREAEELARRIAAAKAAARDAERALIAARRESDRAAASAKNAAARAKTADAERLRVEKELARVSKAADAARSLAAEAATRAEAASADADAAERTLDSARQELRAAIA